MSTLKSLLQYGKEELEAGNIDNAPLDAWLLLEHVCRIERSYYYVHSDETVDPNQSRQYRELIRKRNLHIPLQQLTGEAWFMGLPFCVNEHVLIPRQDTECLVEEVLRRGEGVKRVLDLCTGSGCILLSLLQEWYVNQKRQVYGTGADISPEALTVAAQNAKQLSLKAEFLQSDLFGNITGVFDLIVSNPPYIPTGHIQGLMEEVKSHEPSLALDGGRDGYDFYRKIVRLAPAYLSSQGWLCLEIGYDQGDGLRALLREAGYCKIQIIQDLAGLDRVAVGQCTK